VEKRKILIGAAVVLVLAVAVTWAFGRFVRAGDDTLLAGPTDDKITLYFFKNPTPVASFSVQDLDGRTFSTESLRGKVTIVNFWATWCPPCRAEMPDLVKLQDRYRDQLQIIGVSQDEGSPASVKEFAISHGLNYPIVMSTPELEKIFSGVSAIPTSFIIDREGRVVQKHVGMLNIRTTEQEARSLAGLSVNASVEEVEDSNKTMIVNAAQATRIPGISLDKLSPEIRTEILQRLNSDTCTCGCNLTLAACRINDPNCGISLPKAQQVVQEICQRLDPTCSTSNPGVTLTQPQS
jgi:thiol-disulfide isomerase/thioredoxin